MATVNALCLYCGKVTGTTTSPNPVCTVCYDCEFKPLRDEALEVAAGMRPWCSQNQLYPTATFRGIRLSIEDNRVAQEKWDAEQERIKQFNAAHAGPSYTDLKG